MAAPGRPGAGSAPRSVRPATAKVLEGAAPPPPAMPVGNATQGPRAVRGGRYPPPPPRPPAYAQPLSPCKAEGLAGPTGPAYLSPRGWGPSDGRQRPPEPPAQTRAYSRKYRPAHVLRLYGSPPPPKPSRRALSAGAPFRAGGGKGGPGKWAQMPPPPPWPPPPMQFSPRQRSRPVVLRAVVQY